MDKIYVTLIIFFIIGAGLVGYGIFMGDEGGSSLQVLDEINESSIQDGQNVIEYEELGTEFQDSFRRALGEDTEVKTGSLPSREVNVVRYEGTYYPIRIAEGDAGQSGMFFSITAGASILIICSGSWFFLRRSGSDNDFI